MTGAAPSRGRGAARRGSAYLLVLGITTMLVVMGISGVLLGRVAVEESDLQQDQAIARLAAQVALDVTHKQLDLSGDTWRATTDDDQWQSARAYAGATIRVKFVDEIDGELDNDNTQPFRVYTQAQSGDAVRLYSVELIPLEGGGYKRNARTLRQETLDRGGLDSD